MSGNGTRTGNYISLADDYPGFALKDFCVPKHYEDDLDHILIPNGLIRDRIERIGSDIATDFDDSPMVALCVLKGGYKFFTDLVDRLARINRDKDTARKLSIDFIRLKSYHNDSSSGEITVIGDKECFENLRGKNVLIVEDIVDTGATMTKLLDLLKPHQPKSVKVASLLWKRTSRSVGYVPDYIGWEIPDRFVVGYALDYNEVFRDLAHVCVVNEKGRIKYQQ